MADYERYKLLIIPWSLVRIQAGPVLQINELRCHVFDCDCQNNAQSLEVRSLALGIGHLRCRSAYTLVAESDDARVDLLNNSPAMSQSEK